MVENEDGLSLICLGDASNLAKISKAEIKKYKKKILAEERCINQLAYHDYQCCCCEDLNSFCEKTQLSGWCSTKIDKKIIRPKHKNNSKTVEKNLDFSSTKTIFNFKIGFPGEISNIQSIDNAEHTKKFTYFEDSHKYIEGYNRKHCSVNYIASRIEYLNRYKTYIRSAKVLDLEQPLHIQNLFKPNIRLERDNTQQANMIIAVNRLRRKPNLAKIRPNLMQFQNTKQVIYKPEFNENIKGVCYLDPKLVPKFGDTHTTRMFEGKLLLNSKNERPVFAMKTAFQEGEKLTDMDQPPNIRTRILHSFIIPQEALPEIRNQSPNRDVKQGRSPEQFGVKYLTPKRLFKKNRPTPEKIDYEELSKTKYEDNKGKAYPRKDFLRERERIIENVKLEKRKELKRILSENSNMEKDFLDKLGENDFLYNYSFYPSEREMAKFYDNLLTRNTYAKLFKKESKAKLSVAHGYAYSTTEPK